MLQRALNLWYPKLFDLVFLTKLSTLPAYRTCKSFPQLSDLLTAISTKEGSEPFGAFASGVSAAYTSKVFISSGTRDLVRLNSGIAGITLSGDIAVKTIVARSCLPVGPRYRVTKRNGTEILMLQSDGEGENEASSPLEKLDLVLKVCDLRNTTISIKI